MKETTIDFLHRFLGVGMDRATVSLLASEHIDTISRHQVLTTLEHLEFLYNNVARRFDTPPKSDLGAHFVPSLLMTCLGVGIYLAGGKAAIPNTAPAWPVIPLVAGLFWLFIQSVRAGGFPTRGAIFPSLVTAFGTGVDALLLPIVNIEDHFVRAGLYVFTAAGPAMFIMLRFVGPEDGLSWLEMRDALAGSRRLRSAWNLLFVSITLLAVGELLAAPRSELPDTLQAGAAIAGVGLAWMAQSFRRAVRWPKAG